MSVYIITSFYKFVVLEDVSAIKQHIQLACQEQGVVGTVILAREGINATLAGSRAAISEVLSVLVSCIEISDSDLKFAKVAERLPFRKLKVMIKKEIVTFGVPGLEPHRQTGTPVGPNAWNQLLLDPTVQVIDTRNQFEIAVGTFEGAIDPQTAKFSDFATYVQACLDPKKHQKIAMFCTGGIRCEKASSYLLQQGFETVYMLQGGILNYLEKTDVDTSLWKGKCFVFDDRTFVEKEDLLTHLS